MKFQLAINMERLAPALERSFTPPFRAEAPETIALVRAWITRNDPVVYPEIYRALAESPAAVNPPLCVFLRDALGEA